jgi:LysM repeat protein
MLYRYMLCFLFVAASLLCGCEQRSGRQLHAQSNDPIFQRGCTYLKQGKEAAALRCFQKIIYLDPNQCAEAHFECGEIYLTKDKDPIAAIYHYREYLAQFPNGKQAPLVRQRIATAEKVFLSQLPPLRHLAEDNPSDLLHSLKLLQDENIRLRRQVNTLREQINGLNSVAAVEAKRSEVAAKNQPVAKKNTKSHHYSIAKGDTLSSISQKIYGTPSRWKDIFDANRQLLPSPSQLTIGQTLTIPE